MDSKDDEFNKAMDQLQEELYQEELRDFTKKVVDEYHHPHNWGQMEDADVYAAVTGPCGDTQKLFLKISGNTITKASFLTDGCGPTIACGSKLTQMITNLTLDEAKKISPQELEDALDGLPENHKHCALLAVNTLQKALSDYPRSH